MLTSAGSAAAASVTPMRLPIAEITSASASSLRTRLRAAGAQRHADGHLPLPPVRANEAQIGDVAARDEQHDHDGAQQDPQRLAQAADEILQHRVDEGPIAAVAEEGAVVLGLHLLDRALHQGDQVRGGLVRPNARLQPSGRVPAEGAGRRVRQVELRRQPHIWRPVPIEPRGRDAQDLGWGVIDPDGPSNQRLVGAVPPRPQPVADHGHARSVGTVFLRSVALARARTQSRAS